MTVSRFRRIVAEMGLRCLGMRFNVSDRRVVGLMSLLRRLPGLEEHFTQNVYGVWAKPA
jgi:hypothetical protein